MKYFRISWNCNPLSNEKSHLHFPCYPTLKIEMLSSLPFFKIWLEAKPTSHPHSRKGGTHYEVCHIMWFFAGTLIWSQTNTHTCTHTHTHIHTQEKHITHSGWPSRLTHQYKYIFTPTVMCSYSSYLCYTEWIIVTHIKILLSTMSSFQTFSC